MFIFYFIEVLKKWLLTLSVNIISNRWLKDCSKNVLTWFSGLLITQRFRIKIDKFDKFFRQNWQIIYWVVSGDLSPFSYHKLYWIKFFEHIDKFVNFVNFETQRSYLRPFPRIHSCKIIWQDPASGGNFQVLPINRILLSTLARFGLWVARRMFKQDLANPCK